MTAKAYIVANVTVHDPEAYETYRKGNSAIVEQFGGRFLVRGGALHPLEGEPPAERLVIIEFPSVERAKEFYNSEDYQALVPHRWANSSATSLLIAEGLPE
jgi:uncharacterized protein (DUF1330 family)